MIAVLISPRSYEIRLLPLLRRADLCSGVVCRRRWGLGAALFSDVICGVLIGLPVIPMFTAGSRLGKCLGTSGFFVVASTDHAKRHDFIRFFIQAGLPATLRLQSEEGA